MIANECIGLVWLMIRTSIQLTVWVVRVIIEIFNNRNDYNG